MVHDPENPFGEFEDVAKNTEAAKPASSAGRLPVFANYKGVCTTVDLEGDGVLVDKEVFTTGSGTKALKIFLEILEPEKVGDVTVKGEIHEHVFWVTDGMVPYIKRDVPIITDKPWESMAQFAREKWAGMTVEFGLKDELYMGFMRSKVSYFAPWKPGQETEKPKAAADPKKPAEKPKAATPTKSKAAAPTKSKAAAPKPAAAGTKGSVDF